MRPSPLSRPQEVGPGHSRSTEALRVVWGTQGLPNFQLYSRLSRYQAQLGPVDVLHSPPPNHAKDRVVWGLMSLSLGYTWASFGIFPSPNPHLSPGNLNALSRNILLLKSERTSAGEGLGDRATGVEGGS